MKDSKLGAIVNIGVVAVNIALALICVKDAKEAMNDIIDTVSKK